jgi:hypothetical protein
VAFVQAQGNPTTQSPDNFDVTGVLREDQINVLTRQAASRYYLRY